MVARTFWIAYSAYSRSVTPQVQHCLLKILSHEHTADWHERGDFKVVWHDAYAAMVNYYIDRLKFYGAKYMDSPAGMALKAAITKGRKRKIALPVVNEQTLFSFAGAEGLVWTIKEVGDFFGLLREFTNTEDFETTVCLPLTPSFC